MKTQNPPDWYSDECFTLKMEINKEPRAGNQDFQWELFSHQSNFIFQVGLMGSISSIITNRFRIKYDFSVCSSVSNFH